MPHREETLHLGAAQIEVSILEAYGFCDVGIILDDELRGLGLIQNFNSVYKDFDVSRREVWISRFGRPSHNPPGDRYNTFASQRMGRLVNGGIPLRVENNLSDSRAVAEIDEHNHSMVTAALDPAIEHYTLADMCFIQFTTAMGPKFHASLAF